MKVLKDLREDNNVSINYLLKFLNVSRTTYYNYENDISNPSYDILIKLANFYHVSIDYLLEHNTNKANEDISLTELIIKKDVDKRLTFDEKKAIKMVIESFLNDK